MTDTTTQRPGSVSHRRMRDDSPFALIFQRERLLLVIAGIFLLLTQTSLILVWELSIFEYWRCVVWIGCAMAGHIALQRRLPRRDTLIFPIIMLLTGIGLILIARLEPIFANRQSLWLILSLGAMIGLLRLPRDLRWLSRFRYLWLAVGMSLLVLTIIIGRNPTSDYGPRLWLGVFDIYFQPTELLKLLLVVFLASYLADHHAGLGLHGRRIGSITLPPIGFIAPLVLMYGLSIIVVVWQRDLGTAILFFVVFIVMLYIASEQPIYVVGGFLLLIVAGFIGYHLYGFHIGSLHPFDVVRQRFDIWLNPWADAADRAFQIVQSLLTLAAGGLFGQGIGQGSPAYTPVVHSDFIFAAIGEEWGLLGTLAILLCIAFLVMRGIKIAKQCQTRPFRCFLAVGISLALCTQSLLIMGGTIRLLPLTGVTLPFVSYGGSSLLICFLMAGLLLILSADTSSGITEIGENR